jgi:hypothetical protein
MARTKQTSRQGYSSATSTSSKTTTTIFICRPSILGLPSAQQTRLHIVEEPSAAAAAAAAAASQNKEWQGEVNIDSRRVVAERILKILDRKKRRIYSSSKSSSKSSSTEETSMQTDTFCKIAKRLEHLLFIRANTKAEYLAMHSVKRRLSEAVDFLFPTQSDTERIDMAREWILRPGDSSP